MSLRARLLDLVDALERDIAGRRGRTVPLERYRRDIVAYARERLGMSVLFPHQEAILRAVQRAVEGTGRPRIAVRSGQKVGKSWTAIAAGLWFYETQTAGRVFVAAAIQEQTKLVLWRELGETLRKAKEAGQEIPGERAASPAGGFVSPDGARELKGVSGREIEAIAGLSGNQLFILDEASHLPESKGQVFAGNTMGGGTVLFFSNPTRNSGPFFDAFHSQKEFWETFHVDAEDVAEWQAKTGIRIPYTATHERIAQFAEMYGRDSAFWFLRVKGEFLRNETGRAIPMFRIEEALARWGELGDDEPLVIGYDPAGPGDGGDEHAWAARRGAKLLALHLRRGLSEDASVAETLSLLRVWRRERESVSIVVDAEGPIGSVIHAKLRAESESRRLHDSANGFDVQSVRSSSKYVRDRQKFARVRDELIWALAEWLSTAGIPRDDKLQAELYEPVWTSLPDGRITATSKDEIRSRLGRSPDRFDALALSVYRPVSFSLSTGAGGAGDPYQDLRGQPYTRGRTDEAGNAEDPRYLGEAYGVTRRR